MVYEGQGSSTDVMDITSPVYNLRLHENYLLPLVMQGPKLHCLELYKSQKQSKEQWSSNQLYLYLTAWLTQHLL